MWVAVEGWLSLELTPAGHASNIVSTGELVGVGMLIPVLTRREGEFLFPFYFVPCLPTALWWVSTVCCFRLQECEKKHRQQKNRWISYQTLSWYALSPSTSAKKREDGTVQVESAVGKKGGLPHVTAVSDGLSVAVCRIASLRWLWNCVSDLFGLQ